MRGSRSILVALAAFTATALAVFRPTLSELAHTTPAFQGNATDALFLMWATSWVSHALFTDPAGLFDAPIFHPARDTLAYGDHMIGQALAGLPVWLATGNPLLEYNLLVLASYVLGATAMFAYARATGAGAAAAAVAGLAFAFTPYRFHSPLWLQVLCTAFMPVALLGWLRFAHEARRRDWMLWVAAWAAHALMGLYLALYFTIVMGALAVLGLAAAPARGRRGFAAGSLAAPLVVAGLVAPTVLPYAELRGLGHVRTLALDTPWTFFLPGPGTLTGGLAGLSGPAQFGPGLAIVALALLGLTVGRGQARPAGLDRRFVWTAHALGLAVTLALVLTPVRIQLAIPGLDMVRNTNRAFFVSLLFVAAFAADGATWALGRLRGRAAAAGAILLVALVLADLGTPPRERRRMPVGDEVPAVYAWLRTLPPDAVVVDGPSGPDGAARAMYFQIFHWRPTPTGYSGYVSPAALWVNLRLAKFPHPELLRALAALGVTHVVWHFGTPARADAFVVAHPPGALETAARLGTDAVFRLTVPAPTAPPAAPAYPGAGLRAAATPEAGPTAALLDGDPATTWSLSVASGGPPPVLAVDLGRPRAVSGVRVVPVAADQPGAYLAEVETSNDREHWVPTDAWLVPEDWPAFIHAPERLPAYVARFRTRRARYVRLVNRELAFWGGPWEMKDLTVLGDCDAEPIAGCPPAPPEDGPT